MHVAWTCHTPTCISSKFVRMRQKKRCEFQTSETQSKWFPFLARTCAREMCSHRPVLSTEIGELSCLGNIVSRGFWFRPKRTWTKYVLFLQCNEFVNFVRVYVFCPCLCWTGKRDFKMANWVNTTCLRPLSMIPQKNQTQNIFLQT